MVRKFFSIFIVFALVVTTSFPNASHAMMEHEINSAKKISSAENHNCHKSEQDNYSQKVEQKDKNDSGKCCDKGICNCIGSTCHSGLSKILNNGDDLFSASSSNLGSFVLTNDHIKSSFFSRLKRPPKA